MSNYDFFRHLEKFRFDISSFTFLLQPITFQNIRLSSPSPSGGDCNEDWRWLCFL